MTVRKYTVNLSFQLILSKEAKLIMVMIWLLPNGAICLIWKKHLRLKFKQWMNRMNRILLQHMFVPNSITLKFVLRRVLLLIMKAMSIYTKFVFVHPTKVPNNQVPLQHLMLRMLLCVCGIEMKHHHLHHLIYQSLKFQPDVRWLGGHC